MGLKATVSVQSASRSVRSSWTSKLFQTHKKLQHTHGSNAENESEQTVLEQAQQNTRYLPSPSFSNFNKAVLVNFNTKPSKLLTLINYVAISAESWTNFADAQTPAVQDTFMVSFLLSLHQHGSNQFAGH